MESLFDVSGSDIDSLNGLLIVFFLTEARHRRSNKYAIIRYLQLQSEDLLGYEYGLRKGAVFQPSYFVAIDRTRQAIVLSIRGTWVS